MMKPINVTITEQNLSKLNERKSETGLTLSELIRRAIDMYISATSQAQKPATAK